MNPGKSVNLMKLPNVVESGWIFLKLTGSDKLIK